MNIILNVCERYVYCDKILKLNNNKKYNENDLIYRLLLFLYCYDY